MRIRCLFQVTLWLILCFLILHIITLTIFSSRTVWPSTSPGSGLDDTGEGGTGGNDDFFWSSRDINSVHGHHLDQAVLRRFENSRWRLAEVTADSKTGPIELQKQPSLVQHRKLGSEFLIDPPTANRSRLRAALHQINAEQLVLNTDLYNRTDYVLVVQVHDRTEYLRLLIESFRRAKDIHRALIVFSHDFYSTDINRLVRSIGFAKVVQIFFPYSQQLYSNVFPGRDPADCPRNLRKEEAKRQSCLNAKFPDTFGHYREAVYTQTKHHWFWKGNFVFEKLRSVRDYTGPVLFLEEDHYVAEDFLHLLSSMSRLRHKSFPSVDILCLGTYDKKVDYKSHSGRIQVGKWVSSYHNMGMAFGRSVWRKIQACTERFCNFDDYNWDWSLQLVSHMCIPSRLQVMLLAHSPRIFHIGECGVHHKKKLCSPHSLVARINKILDSNLLALYPTSLKHIGAITIHSRVPGPNGGWSDPRDRALCLSFVYGKKSNFPIPEERPGSEELGVEQQSPVLSKPTNAKLTNHRTAHLPAS